MAKGRAQVADEVVEAGSKTVGNSQKSLAVSCNTTFLVLDSIDLGFAIMDLVQSKGFNAAKDPTEIKRPRRCNSILESRMLLHRNRNLNSWNSSNSLQQLTLVIFFSAFKTERKNLNFPKFELLASAILLGAQGFLGR